MKARLEGYYEDGTDYVEETEDLMGLLNDLIKTAQEFAAAPDERKKGLAVRLDGLIAMDFEPTITPTQGEQSC